MISHDILIQINHLEIYTRRILATSLSGDSRSAIKGTGFEFDQIREYQLGDDIRSIDWNASARSNSLLVKQYREERSRTIIVAVDCSGSAFFGSDKDLRYTVSAQIAGVLALVAEYGKDKVGLIVFGRDIKKYIPPLCSRVHTRMIMEYLFNQKVTNEETDFVKFFDFVAQLRIRKAMVAIVSDFEGVQDFSKVIGVVAARHDVIALRNLDALEKILPQPGFLPVWDPESGQEAILDLRSEKSCKKINDYLQRRISDQDGLFSRYGVDCLTLQSDKTFMIELVNFFRRRMTY